MPEASDVLKLKERAERDSRKAAEAQGALKEVLRTLKNKYGVESVKDANKLLDRLDRESKSTGVEFDKAVEKYEREYRDALAETGTETEPTGDDE
jgi:hypothetical protein